MANTSYSFDLLLHKPPSPLQRLQHPMLEQKQVQVWVKRDDLLRNEGDPVHHAFCGNKWRKLKYNLLKAREGGFRQLVTFGGAFSNQVAATASAGQLFGFATVGVIRGEAPPGLNATLRTAQAAGMQLFFLDRTSYRQKHIREITDGLQNRWPGAYWIPEGGTNAPALRGAGEIALELRDQLPDGFDFLATSCGTGGTLAGILLESKGQFILLGFPALRGDFLAGEVTQLTGVKEGQGFAMINDYHFGGYARFNDRLLEFVHFFFDQFGILLDPVYTGKAAFGLWQKIKEDYYLPGSKIVLLHTGGLQGWQGFTERWGIEPPGKS